jgi:hypothetical protein
MKNKTPKYKVGQTLYNVMYDCEVIVKEIGYSSDGDPTYYCDVDYGDGPTIRGFTDCELTEYEM